MTPRLPESSEIVDVLEHISARLFRTVSEDFDLPLLVLWVCPSPGRIKEFSPGYRLGGVCSLRHPLLAGGRRVAAEDGLSPFEEYPWCLSDDDSNDDIDDKEQLPRSRVDERPTELVDEVGLCVRWLGTWPFPEILSSAASSLICKRRNCFSFSTEAEVLEQEYKTKSLASKSLIFFFI